MRRIIPIVALAALLPWDAAGQEDADDAASALFGGDRYVAGREVAAAEATPRDLFIAGEIVGVEEAVGGSAHAAGRRVRIEAQVGGSLYAMGYEVLVAEPVAGGVSIAAAEIAVEGAVGGNLRAAGSDVRLSADVDGAAVLAGRDVRLDGTIGGDLSVTADRLSFAENAQVAGEVTVYSDNPEDIAVPASVAPPERVTIRDARELRGASRPFREEGGTALGAALFGFVMSVITVAALAAIFVFAMPEHLAAVRRHALARPGNSILWGFVGMSTLAGAGIVLALTVIGLLLVPACFVIAGLAGLMGYVFGSYILGVGLWMRFGKPEPETSAEKIGLAALGAFVTGVLVLIPFLGWLFLLALTFLGLGASLTLLLPRPEWPESA